MLSCNARSLLDFKVTKPRGVLIRPTKTDAGLEPCVGGSARPWEVKESSPTRPGAPPPAGPLRDAGAEPNSDLGSVAELTCRRPPLPLPPADAPTALELAATAAPRNVIFMMGDGMGLEHIQAARIWLHGDETGGETPLNMEQLPCQGLIETANVTVTGGITDSAASATAMATGLRVYNGVVSQAQPGTGANLTSALQIQRSRGKRTGLVTTFTSIVDASPAAFGAHALRRYDGAILVDDLLTGTRPNVLFGEASGGLTPNRAYRHGYQVVVDQFQLESLDLSGVEFLSGQFPHEATPPLPLLTEKALESLSQSKLGFFLFVEHEGTDEHSHANSLAPALAHMKELDDAVQVARNWASARQDTLLVVGADHETGGLMLEESSPKAGNIPEHRWTTGGHTSTPVRFFAEGPQAGRVLSMVDNTELFPLLAGFATLNFSQGASSPLSEAYGGTVDVNLTRSAAGDSRGNAPSLQVAGPEEGDERQVLVRFDRLAGQLPPEHRIQGARLYLSLESGGGNSVTAHRMLLPWTENSTWRAGAWCGNGVQADGSEAMVEAEGLLVASSEGTGVFDVGETVKHWIRNPQLNFGWLLRGQGVGSTSLSSSEGARPPRLVIYYE